MNSRDYFHGLMPTVTPDPEDEEWWAACARRELTVPICSSCGASRFPISPICPRCYAPDMQLTSVSGNGRIFSYTVQYNAPFPVLAEICPYNIAIIELDDEARTHIVSNVVGASPEELAVDAAVAVVWEQDAAGMTLPRFRLVHPDRG